MYKLPGGKYTVCIELFPVTMNDVSVDGVSTSLNITQQTTKQFSNYTRSILHVHNWRVSPPQVDFFGFEMPRNP